MRRAYFRTYIYSLLFALTFLVACSGQQESANNNQPFKELVTVPLTPPNSQLAFHIRNIYQDKNGNFWFGTNGYGVAHYDGDSLSYFSFEQGFNGQQVTGIFEDKEKNIWFATDKGVVKYDWSSDDAGGMLFTNFSGQQYFNGEQFWCIYADSKSNIWGGSSKGIYKYDGADWSAFKLPLPDTVTGTFITEGTSWSILEDKRGNMWFSTNGYGVYKYDGNSFTLYTKEDGLCGNNVYRMLEDKKSNIWFAMREGGGASRFDGETFENFTYETIGIYLTGGLYEDKTGNIWFYSHDSGTYYYDGDSFTNFYKKHDPYDTVVHSIFEDKEGRLWFGGPGGLTRYDGSSFVNVTRNGPW